MLVDLVDIPVRDEAGRVRRSDEIAARMAESIDAATAAGRHTLVHAVHGSKTGLILPSPRRPRPAAGGAWRRRHPGDRRLPGADHRRGGARLSGARRDRRSSPDPSSWAGRRSAASLWCRSGSSARAAPLPEGLATIFRRAEWPAAWPGVERLPDSANLGLLLRLEASIFELERFQALAAAEVERIVLAFHAAVRAEIVEKTPARRVAPYPPGDREEADTHPIEMRTLSTLDLSGFGGGAATFEDAQRWHKAMLAHGVRLGQPVKCVRLADGAWGATLRIGLAMGQIADRAGLGDEALARSFAEDMAKVREALVAVAGVIPPRISLGTGRVRRAGAKPAKAVAG